MIFLHLPTGHTRSDLFQDAPKMWAWRETHGSICIQEGQPDSASQYALARADRAALLGPRNREAVRAGDMGTGLALT
jgi:hypothetical protein